MPFSGSAFSFILGFVTASIFWWLVARARPLWGEVRENWAVRREEAKARRSSGVEENYRRNTLRRAQGMHLAASLFALDEIIEVPRLLAPLHRVEPGAPPVTEDIVARTLPYMPSWPELAAVYHAPTLSLPQALSGSVNLVITGQPGAGKTIALAYLASLAANRNPELGNLSEAVPFFYHVADLRLPEGETKDILNPILDAVSLTAPVLDLARLPNFVENTFINGQALLLLDGFDELSPDEQTKVSSYLKVLLKFYPKTRIVTCGCPEQLDGLIGLGFEPVALMPWNRKQRVEFIERWGERWAQTVAMESWSQEAATLYQEVDPLLIKTWLSIDNHTLTPLELTLKVWAGYAGDSLGPGILDAIATHIRRLAPQSTPVAALETLGMQVALSARALFDSRSAREWVKNFELPDEEVKTEAGEGNELPGEEPSSMSPTPTGKTGPLGKTGPFDKTGPLGKPAAVPASSRLLGKMIDSGLLVACPDNRMRFLHPVFGGYLAGRGLAVVNADNALLQQPDWAGKRLAMRYVAACGDATGLANAMLKQAQMPLQQSLFSAARWLRDAPREAPWRGKIFSQLISLLQTEGLPLALRAQSVAAFYWSGDPGAAPLFRQLFKTRSFELLQLAALGSGAVCDHKAVELLSSLLMAPSLSAQQAACLALVAIGTQPAIETVARALLHGEEDLRRAAAEALANDPREGYGMLKEGMALEDILLRRAVVYGLARIEDEWATEALQHIRMEDEQWVVRNSAGEVLDSRDEQDPRVPRPLTIPSETPWLIEFAGKQGVGISPGSPATEILIAALKSESEEERLAALPYLKRTPSEGVITSLYHAMYRDDPEMREAVFLVLCQLAAGGIKLPAPEQFGLR